MIHQKLSDIFLEIVDKIFSSNLFFSPIKNSQSRIYETRDMMRQFLKSRKFENIDRSYFARNVKLLRLKKNSFHAN